MSIIEEFRRLSERNDAVEKQHKAVLSWETEKKKNSDFQEQVQQRYHGLKFTFEEGYKRTRQLLDQGRITRKYHTFYDRDYLTPLHYAVHICESYNIDHPDRPRLSWSWGVERQGDSSAPTWVSWYFDWE